MLLIFSLLSFLTVLGQRQATLIGEPTYYQTDSTGLAQDSAKMSPTSIHIATHGFFIEDSLRPKSPRRQAILIGDPVYYNDQPDSVKYQKINQLPSTEEEIELIQEMMLKSRLTFDTNGLQMNSSRVLTDYLSAYEAMNLNLDQTKLVVFSCVDSVCYNHWDEYMASQDTASFYGPSYILYAFSEKDSKIKTQFMSRFYEEQIKTNSIPKAYDETIKYFIEKGIELDFKHALIKGK